MATLITKNSSTTTSVPIASQLVQGELAVNVTDKRLFTEDSGGVVVEVGTNPSSLTLSSGTANGVAYLNGTKVLTTGSALTFDGTTFAVSSSDSRFNVTSTGNSQTAGISIKGGPIAGSDYNFIESLNSSGTQQWYLGGNGTANVLAFKVATAEQMRLTSTGLGIGTTSPLSLLTLLQSADGFDKGITLTRAGANRGTIFLNASNDTLNFGRSTATSMSLDSSGNLGLGVTPSAWDSIFRVQQIGVGGSFIAGRTDANQIHLGVNAYYASGYKYSLSSFATHYYQFNGQHIWETAPSGTAGNPVTFTQAMTLDASGNLVVGGTTANRKLEIVEASNNYQMRIGAGSVAASYTYDIGRSNSDGYLYFYGNQSGANGYVFDGVNGERARIDSSGNLGLGVTPSAWSSVAMEIGYGGNALWGLAVNDFRMSTNLARISGGNQYKANGAAAMYNQASGGHYWYNAPSGTAGAAITFTQAMTLDASGNLLVGQTSNGAQNANSMYFNPTTGYGANLVISHLSGTPSSREYQQYLYNGTAIGSITQNGTTAVAYNTSSDYRLKNITGSITTSGAYIDSLKPVEGTWKADGSTFVGLIAHETQEVSRTTVATGTKDGEEMQGMDYSSAEIIANLIAEIQDLRKRLAAAGI